MLKLEVFEVAGAPSDTGYLDARTADKLRMDAYDLGYAAGWQDAVTQERDADHQRIAATLDAIQALAFTFAEARALVEGQLTELVETLIARILPVSLGQALPAHVAQEVRVMLARDPQAQLTLLCAPGASAALAPVLDDLAQGSRVILQEEAAFTSGQVMITGHDQKRVIDLDTLLGLLDKNQRNSPEIATAYQKGRP
jgi:flagellar assembly protein FliH